MKKRFKNLEYTIVSYDEATYDKMKYNKAQYVRHCVLHLSDHGRHPLCLKYFPGDRSELIESLKKSHIVSELKNKVYAIFLLSYWCILFFELYRSLVFGRDQVSYNLFTIFI